MTTSTLEPREMDKLPYFRFFPARFLASELAVTLSNEEMGGYLRLLLFSWINHGLPGDRKVLGRIAQLEGKELERVLSSGFTKDGDRLRSAWLENERAWAMNKSLRAKESIAVRVAQGGYAKKTDPEKEAKRAAILATYQKAAEESDDEDENPNPNPNTDIEIQTKIQTETQTARAPARSKTSEERTKYERNTNVSHNRNGFEDFWKAYPRKVAKQDAERAWGKLKPDAELQRLIRASVERHKETRDWRKDGGQYIPYPATWLNGKRWVDEQNPMDHPANIFGGSGMDDTGGL